MFNFAKFLQQVGSVEEQSPPQFKMTKNY